MNWTSSLRRQLHEALLKAFPTWADLDQFVFLELETSLVQITSAANPQSQVVLDLMRWAEAMGRLEELVTRAHQSKPGNAALRAVAEALQGETADGGASPSETAPPPEPQLPLPTPQAVRQALVDNFSLAEMRLLAATVGVELEDLGGESRPIKALEFVGYMQRRGRMVELVEAIRAERSGAL